MDPTQVVTFLSQGHPFIIMSVFRKGLICLRMLVELAMGSTCRFLQRKQILSNYAVQLNQKRSDLVFCLFASKRILLEHFSAYDLILRPNFIPSRDNKIQNLKPVSP